VLRTGGREGRASCRSFRRRFKVVLSAMSISLAMRARARIPGAPGSHGEHARLMIGT
jgi:hypothetical protein